MDATTVTAGLERAQDGFAAAVRAALSLSTEDQHRLALLLERTSGGHLVSTTAGAVLDDTAFDEAALEGWIANIANQRPWTRLKLLYEAVASATDELEREALAHHRRTLLEQHPATAVREAVEAAAARNPGAVALGLVGLLLAAVSAGIWMHRAMF